MSNLALNLVDELDTNIGATLTKGVNLFTGPVRMVGDGIPQNCVFCFASGGFQPRPYMGQNKQYRRVFIEVRVRYGRHDYDSGQALAWDVYNALDLSEFSTTDTGSSFVWCKPLSSAPNYISTDKDDFHMWGITFEIGHDKEL